MRRQRRRTPCGSPPDGNPVTRKSRLRAWLVRLGMAVLSPLLFFLILELSLRLAGFGYPTSFFLRKQADGKEVLIQNDRFGWRFLGPALSRAPWRLRIPAQKPRETCRVFVLGESAAYGDPRPEYSLPRMLQVLLSDRFPETRIEVVNAALTAINSHAILPIARDCTREAGDLWVIYMGNNEVVGPFGSGTVFGPKAPPLALTRGSLALKKTRTGQLLDGLVSRLHGQVTDHPEWGGMTMFLKNQVRHDDPRMDRVYTHFARNLADMLDIAAHCRTKVIACSVASNLRDCPPFASQHRPDLAESQRREWERLWQAGIDALNGGKITQALEHFQAAGQIDSHFAELQYRWGLACGAAGQAEEAHQHLTLARDYDTLRFRADSRLNDLIRKTTSGRESQGVRFLDIEKQIQSRSPQGSPGNDLFYEHVHFNFEGNYWLARSVAEEAEKALAGTVVDRSGPKRPWLSASDCAHRLAWTDWDHFETLQSVFARINDPPFKDQSNHAQSSAFVRQQMEQLLARLGPEGLRRADECYREALQQSPDDWVLHQGRARLLKKTGNVAGAAEALRQVARLLGPSSELYVQLGLLLNEQSRPAEASDEFQSALRLDPRQVDALNGLGMALAQQKRYPEAVTQFEKALRLKPYSMDAHLNLAKALKALGKSEEATRHFRLGMARRPVSAEGLTLLGKVCMEQGWVAEAITNFTAAVRQDPTDAAAHFCLGVAQAASGDRGEAERQFAEAVRLNASFAEARVGLGIELGRRGEDAEALEQFAAAATLKPGFVEAHLNLGVALSRSRRREEALEEFRKVLQLDPTNVVARKYVEGTPAK